MQITAFVQGLAGQQVDKRHGNRLDTYVRSSFLFLCEKRVEGQFNTPALYRRKKSADCARRIKTREKNELDQTLGTFLIIRLLLSSLSALAALRVECEPSRWVGAGSHRCHGNGSPRPPVLFLADTCHSRAELPDSSVTRCTILPDLHSINLKCFNQTRVARFEEGTLVFN